MQSYEKGKVKQRKKRNKSQRLRKYKFFYKDVQSNGIIMHAYMLSLSGNGHAVIMSSMSLTLKFKLMGGGAGGVSLIAHCTKYLPFISFSF